MKARGEAFMATLGFDVVIPQMIHNVRRNRSRLISMDTTIMSGTRQGRHENQGRALLPVLSSAIKYDGKRTTTAARREHY